MSEQIKGAKYDKGKIPLSTVPTGITWAIGAVRKYGLEKYGDAEEWGLIEEERWADAAYRHFLKYIEDPAGVDSESGLPHLWHLAANIAFMIEMNPESLRRVNDLADGVFSHNPFPLECEEIELTNDEVIDWIDTKLKENSMSRRKLAVACGVSPSTMQTMLERRSSVPYELFQKIRKVFKVTEL